MTLYPGPYDLGAPDGHRYFAILGPQKFLLSGYRKLLEAQAIATRIGDDARALAFDSILAQTQREVDLAAVETAEYAEQAVSGYIQLRQLRPDPPGKSAGRRLKDSIQARAIKTFPSGGAVGIGDLDVLKQVADADGQEYWRAQEFGSTHLLGKAMFGVYMPGASQPNRTDFRQHPIFEGNVVGVDLMGFGEVAGPIIRNPIPEKAFLREGAYDAAVFRRDAFGVISRKAVQEMRLVTSENHPTVRQAARYLRRRAP